jgi:hypothetical protein
MLAVVFAGLVPLLSAASSGDLARAEALAEARDYEAAVEVLYRVIDDCRAPDAEIARAYLTLGWAESALERDDDARRSFAEALLLDKGATLSDRAPERSRALLESVRREGGQPWGTGRLVVSSVPPVPVEIDGRRHNTPVEVTPPYDRVVLLTNPPINVELACRRLGTTRVDAYLAESMRVDDDANVALVATGATLAGMGAVMSIVALAIYDPEDPKASLVIGTVGGAFLVGGAIPLGIAGVNYATAPPIAHMVRIQPPGGDAYDVLFNPTTGAPLRQ